MSFGDAQPTIHASDIVHWDMCPIWLKEPWNQWWLGILQSDKLLKPVLISDAAKCQLYSLPISLTGHFAFLSSHFHVCLTHTVSSLLKLLNLVFLPQLAHSQWFPISSFRFVSWSPLLVLVAFPRHFPPFPPYLITKWTHLPFIHPSYQRFCSLSDSSRSSSQSHLKLHPRLPTPAFSLISVIPILLLSAPWQPIPAFLSHAAAPTPHHTTPHHPQLPQHSYPDQLPFSLSHTTNAQCCDCWKCILALWSRAQTPPSNNSSSEPETWGKSCGAWGWNVLVWMDSGRISFKTGVSPENSCYAQAPRSITWPNFGKISWG